MLYELTIGVFEKLADLANVLYNFLFTRIGIGDWSFSLWQVLGGVLIVTLLIAWLIKKLIPIA